MRCHYLSDLHLESQDFPWKLPEGDLLVIAGDLCHARVLDASRTDKYSLDQRDRVLRFVDRARKSFAVVLLVAGNHEHYDGVYQDTVPLLRRHLPDVLVLDDSAAEIDGIRFFGSTLWSDFERRSLACMNGLRRRMGEYFFVKTRGHDADGHETLAKFRPEDALQAHETAWAALQRHVADAGGKPTIVVTHHAPSRLGLNPAHAGNGLDGAFASDLDEQIATLESVPVWIHGHTHVRRRYGIGATTVLANCRGFDGKEISARKFSPDVYVDL